MEVLGLVAEESGGEVASSFLLCFLRLFFLFVFFRCRSGPLVRTLTLFHQMLTGGHCGSNQCGQGKILKCLLLCCKAGGR
jgi:hypothetical protein